MLVQCRPPAAVRPDGTQISFLRSEREWVSFREDESWDLYVINADGTDERFTYLPLSSSRACQITWVPGRRHLVWIDGEGRGGTHVMHASLDEPREAVLMDLPHDYSHEYFPRITAGGEWMIWGAAAEGHEHDRADYELFVWKLDLAVVHCHAPDLRSRERSVARPPS